MTVEKGNDTMNQQLREICKQQVTSDSALALYDSLCMQLGPQLTNGAQHIIGDICILEQFKQDLYTDIKKRGSVASFKNGRQEMPIVNKSGPQIRQYMEQQRKLLGELKLTPASLSVKSSPGGGGPAKSDRFEDFDKDDEDGDDS